MTKTTVPVTVTGTPSSFSDPSAFSVESGVLSVMPGLGSAAGLPIDLAGATLKLTVRVETSLPYHLAGATAELSMADGTKLTAVLTTSKWDQPVTVTAPPADQVKPAS